MVGYSFAFQQPGGAHFLYAGKVGIGGLHVVVGHQVGAGLQQVALHLANRYLRGGTLLLHTQCRQCAGRLAGKDNHRLQPGGAIYHIGNADALFGHDEAFCLAGNQGAQWNIVGGNRVKIEMLGSCGILFVMVVNGIITHRNTRTI